MGTTGKKIRMDFKVKRLSGRREESLFYVNVPAVYADIFERAVREHGCI